MRSIGWRRVVATLAVLGGAALGATLWRASRLEARLFALIQEPWSEITTDAELLADGTVVASQGSTLTRFAVGADGRWAPVDALVQPQFIHRILARGDHLLVAAGQAGLMVVDPEELEVVAEVPVPDGYGFDLASDGTHAVMAGREGGFWILDVTRPRAPRALRRFPGAVPGQGAGLGAGQAWVSVGGDGLYRAALDGSTPATRVLAVRPPPPRHPEPPPYDVAVHRDRTYVALGPDGLGVVDARTGAVVAARGGLADARHTRALDVDASRGLLCAGDYAGHLTVLDLADPDHPRALVTVPLEGTPVHLRCLADRVLVAVGAQGFRVLDLTDPVTPRPLGGFTPGGFAHAVALRHDHGSTLAAVARGAAGVTLERLATDGSTRVVATLPARGTAQHVLLVGPRLYVSEVTGGLGVWDVSTPERPRPLETFEIERHVRAVAALGDDLVVVGGEAPVSVLAPEPGGLVRREVFASRGYAWRVAGASAGDTVYVGALQAGLGIVHRRGPGEAPIWVEPQSFGGEHPMSLLVLGERLYVGDGRGLETYDLADPTEPRRLARRSLGGAFPVGLASDGERLFVAAHAAGLRVIERDADGLAAREAARCAFDAPLAAIAWAEGRLWIAPGNAPLGPLDPDRDERCR